MKGVVFTDPSTASYHSPGHPEAPWRVTRTAERLKSAGFDVRPPAVRATGDDVTRVHTKEHWHALQHGLFFDPDTPAHDGISDIALASLSGALSACDAALSGTPAFSLMRPPGHHAGAERIAGFCYLNNIAIACDRAERAGRRIAILDVDVHHGDGTQSIAEGRPWTFVSLHQVPLYPGTGLRSTGRCTNIPLAQGTDGPAYLAALAPALARVVDAKPDVLAISAGFDTYRECPIAGLALDKDTYTEIGRMIAATKLPRFAVLEGGYADDLPELIENFLRGLFG